MGDILDYGKEDVLKFIQSTIKNNNNVKHDILDKIKYVLGEVIEGDVIEDYSSQGFYYERLWDLCIKFGATNLTLPAIKGKLQTSHIINENPNKIGIEFQSNCWDGNKLNINPGGYLLNKVRSGNSGGYSDITFFNQNYDDKGNKIGGEELYFISVKYFKEEKEISEYDIGKLCSLIREHEKKNRTIKLYIFVKNKKNAIGKFNAQHSSSNILIKYINPGGNYEHIYDVNDLQESFFKLKKILEQYNYLQLSENIKDFQCKYLKVLKDVFIPRFHQELFILKINKLIEHDKEKNILVGAIPRSGKSYIMAGTILEYVKTQEQLHPGKKVKFLLITPAPNETFGEYETIFNKYIEFDTLGIDVVTYKDGVNSKKICGKKDKHCVIIISKQKLGWSAGSNAEKILAKDDESVEVEDEDEVGDEVEDEVEDEDEVGDEVEDKDIKTIKQRVIKLFDANPEIDIMFLDEAHFGMSTEKAQQIVKVLDSAISNTIKIYVTATYNKPLQAYGVKAECKLTWDMNDIQIMQKIDEKTITDNAIQKQFGNDIYVKALEYFGDKTGLSLINKFKTDYAIFPKPYLITSIWDKEFLKVEKLKIGDTEFGWDMNKLFATEGDSDNFANEAGVKEMMRYYFGYPDKTKPYDEQSFYRKKGILPRIRNICLNKCRTLQPQHKTTQLWFLPLGNGKIKNKTKALVNLLTNSNEFNDVKRNYHFFIAVDIEDKTKKGRTINGVTYMNNPKDIKKEIEEVEKKIKQGTDEYKQDNLIILAGQRLQLGISLRNVDIVTLWNSISSADAIFQMLFRSMTEVDVPSCKEKPNEYCDEKKFGFMVDMNPQRALTNVSLFSANISKKTDTDDIQKYRQITDLINIDEDVLYDRYGDDEKSREDFVKELFNKLHESWNKYVENTKTFIIKNISFDITKLELLKPAFEQINIEKGKKTKDQIDGKEDDEMIDPGKKKEKTGKTKGKDKKDVKEKEINLIETASELLSEFISLLNIFTLYADNGAQCILTDISNSNAQITLVDDIDILKSSVYQDEETKDVFLKILNGRLTGKADEPYPENVIEDVLHAMDSLDDKLIVNKIIMSQKKQYYTINEPDKLLEFINCELKPNEKNKKENGEVFTPLSLVNEMLDKLDEAYIKEHGKSIFTEDGFKWFDPAVGIGNFPVLVYQRLMKELITKIPNEEERRKHILEQMIYASELTPKNVFIYKKIFCGEKYKLNIYEGDTLKMDVIKIWRTNMFDVILGNPPYNKGGIRSHTGKQLLEGEKSETIWTKFIDKSFEWLKPDGFLVFINPLSWLKKSHSQHNAMLEKHIVWLKLWDNIKSLATINGKIPISLFILQNTHNTTNKKTDIISEIQGKKLTTTSTEYLNPAYSIPLAFHSIFNKLVGFIETRNLQLEYKTKTIKSSGTKAKIPTEYTLEDMWAVDTYTIKEGLMVKKATEQHPDANKRKLIISNKASFTGAFIDEGKISLTGNHKFYILGDNLELVKKMLDFKIINIIGHYTKYGQDFLDNEAFKYIPDIRKLGIVDITEDEFYTLIGLTHQEITQIKNPSSNEVVDEDEVENDEEVEPKKIVLVPATEAIEDVSMTKPIQSPILKKKTTIKKRPKLVESSGEDKVVPEKPIDPNAEKIFNPLTKRHVKNTAANRKKIEQQTLKRGGKSKKRTRKNQSKNTSNKIFY